MGRKQPNLKTAEAELVATLCDPHFLERRDELVAQIARLQRADTDDDVMSLQLELRDMVAAREDYTTERRATAKVDKAERDRLARTHLPQDRAAIAELNRRLEDHERRDLRDRVIVYMQRCVVDGLAWRASGYDRSLFTVLGDGQRVARFADEAGAEPERRLAQELWDGGTLPFFNDLMTVLNEGDLTVLHGYGPLPDVGIAEVKASGRIKPDSPQARRLDEKLSFLNDNRRAGEDGGEQRLWRTAIPYRHALDQLALLMARARTEGIAHAFVHPALLVTAADLGWCFEHEVDFTTHATRWAGWRDEDTVAAESVGTRLTELRRSIPGMAPLAIFPLTAEDIADLLMCRFSYVATLRPDRLIPDFRARDITLELPQGAEQNVVFFRASRHGVTVTVPAQIRQQMLRELTSVETLIDVVDTLLEDLHRGGSPGDTLVLCDESEAWHRAPVLLG